MIKQMRMFAVAALLLWNHFSWAGQIIDEGDLAGPGFENAPIVTSPTSCYRSKIYNQLVGDTSGCPTFAFQNDMPAGCYVLKSRGPANICSFLHSSVLIYDGSNTPYRTELYIPESSGVRLIGTFKRDYVGKQERGLIECIPLTPGDARKLAKRLGRIKIFGEGYTDPDQLTCGKFASGTLSNPEDFMNCHHYTCSVADAAKSMNRRRCKPVYDPQDMIDVGLLLGGISYDHYLSGIEQGGAMGTGRQLLGAGGMSMAGGLGLGCASTIMTSCSQLAIQGGATGLVVACESGAAITGAGATIATGAGLCVVAGAGGYMFGTYLDQCGLNPFIYPAECIGSFLGSF